MNIQHLKYALEVDRAGSISQAAENLYMGQPNLSKAIKELEQTLNITIFKRTSKGAETTPKGREFLKYAQSILKQFEEMEALGRSEEQAVQSLRVSIPRASYMVDAFTTFLTRLDPAKPMEIDLLETNALRSIRHVSDGRADFGAFRCKAEYLNYFLSMLEENGLVWEELFEFKYRLLVSRSNPLAQMDVVPGDLLSSFIEINHGDTAVPHTPLNATETERGKTPGNKKVYVYERGSQFDILARVPGTFMWVAPMPKDLLQRNGLVQKSCNTSPGFKDILISKKGHVYSELEQMLIDEIKRSVERNLREAK